MKWFTKDYGILGPRKGCAQEGLAAAVVLHSGTETSDIHFRVKGEDRTSTKDNMRYNILGLAEWR